MNIESFFVPLLDLLVKSAGIIILGTVLLAAFRRTSAANRHAVSAAVFAALLLVPFTEFMSPRWSFVLETRTEHARLPDIATVQTAATSRAEPTAGTIEEGIPFLNSWKTLALVLWIDGAPLLLVRRALIGLQLRAVMQRSEEVKDGRLVAMTRELMETSGVHAEVRQSSHCRVPLVAGIIRPAVLLPVEARNWNDSQISFVMRHELGHIHRRDCITRLLASVVCAFYWVNPLVWFAARQMRLAQEQACDDLVLSSGACADEYASQLVNIVHSLQGDRLMARYALAMAQPSTLETRVLAILDGARDHGPHSRRGTLAGCALVTAALALCTVGGVYGTDEGKAAPPTKATAAMASGNPVPAKPEDAALITKEWKVAPNFLKYLESTGVAGKSAATDILRAHGITFGPGAVATYLPTTNRLIVKNEKAQLDLIEALVVAANAKAAAAGESEAGEAASGPGKPTAAKPEGAAWTKASQIVVPKVELREATLSDTVDFLRTKAKELDPKKQGINIILKPDTHPSARLTLSLTNIPLSEALWYVANLAGINITADDNVITLSPLGK